MQRVLVIDDDPDICELVAAAAESAGMRCFTTSQVPAFLEALAEDTDLILLDLLMPEMDGIELLRLLGEQKCRVGIVLMSGVGRRIMETAEEMANAMGLTIVGHIEKPFRVVELEAMLMRRTEPLTASVFRAKPRIAFEDEELRQAVERNEFAMHYQPQVDIASGRTIGVEALVRWQHPVHGLVYPDEFIGRLEAMGLIDALGWIVAAQGLATLGEMREANGGELGLSINVSALSLHDLGFPDRMARMIRERDISPGVVILEITESGLIEELAKTLDILTRLRIKGIQLSIDDFGTGYSMMQQLRHIPATELKIDKSFVQGMYETDHDRVMVRKMIEIGHELKMKVIAEGVETADQLEFLRQNGCDAAQGYFFSRPIPAAELIRWVRDRRGL